MHWHQPAFGRSEVTFREFLPGEENRAKFSALPKIAIEFPKTNEWSWIARWTVAIAFSCHLSATKLHAKTVEVSGKIEPFIRHGLNQIGPGRLSGVLVNFVFHFCFLKSNGALTDLTDVFAKSTTITAKVEQLCQRIRSSIIGMIDTGSIVLVRIQREPNECKQFRNGFWQHFAWKKNLS
jgi:hypothetical protein